VENISGEYPNEKPGRYKIAVKASDVLGNDTTTGAEVRV